MPGPADPDRPSSLSPNRCLCLGFRCVKTVAVCLDSLHEAVPDFRVCGHPSGLQSSLCTLHLVCSGLTLLLSKCNTRYGWLARPYPVGTSTPQETPSFAWRTNARFQALPKAGARDECRL